MRLSRRQHFGLLQLLRLGGSKQKTGAQIRLVSTSRFGVLEPFGPRSDIMATTTDEERAEAAAMRSSNGTKSEGLSGIASVEIDESLQKYVLILAGGNHYLVRGASSAAYHKDAAGPCVAQLRSLGIDYKVLGGGRINVEPEKKSILIYGFSYGFPWENNAARHDIAAEVIREMYPDWSITTSNEGY